MKTINPYYVMGAVPISKGLLQHPTLSCTAKICYSLLVSHCNQKGIAWPKHSLLAEEMGTSVSTIRRSIRELVDERLIRVFQPKGKQKFLHFANQYVFLSHACFEGNLRVVAHDHSEEVAHDRSNNYNNSYVKDLRQDKLLSEDKSSKRRTEPGGSGSTGKLNRRSKAQILKSEREKLARSNGKPKTPEPLPKVPAKVRSVIKYWQGKGLHVSREGTKAHRDSIKKVAALFAGRAFNHSEFEEYQRQRFSIKDIRRAVDRFALAALNPHYLPVSQYKKKLRSMPIGAFIYSPFSQNGTGRSQFIHYLENPPVVTGTPVEPLEDLYPKMTSALRRAYRKGVLGGVEPKMDVREENHFIIASQKLIDFLKKNRGKLKWYQELTPSLLAGWVMEALRQATGEDLSKVTPGWFSSEMMFNRRLPAYLSSQALLGEEADSSGGTRVGFLH